MVRVVDKTIDRRIEEVEIEQFIKIAKRELKVGDDAIHCHPFRFSIYGPSNYESIYVFLCFNTIRIETPIHYDQAFLLAQIYEKEKGEEFTLKTFYSKQG